MPIICKLETERGEVLGEINDEDLLQGLLPEPNDETFHCLRFIDPYGNTVFNRAQAERFLVELDLLERKARTTPEKELLARIETLARRCRDDVHLYLKFYGD